MSIIEITRGFEFRYEVANQYAIMILKSDTEKLNITSLQVVDGKYYLVADAEDTKKYRPNTYKYQIIDNKGILQQGTAIVKQNFALADQNQSVKSRNEIILDAIEAQLAGVATAGQQSISVGDKSISYLSFDQLLKAREFFKKKIAEQKKGYVSGNESRIKYRWGF